jgi:transposase-like protein
MKRIPRRIFTAEFNLEAIKLVTEHFLTQAEAARKLDIAIKSLREWKEQHERGAVPFNFTANGCTIE